MAVEFKDYYETLGVSRSATPEEIKQAFRKLARIHHPDVAKNKATGEARFKEINEAYEVLSDPEKRRRYDELGVDWQANGAPPPPTPGASRRYASAGAGAPDFEFDGTGFSDFFESFFGGGRERFNSRRGRGGYDFDGEEFEADNSDAEADLLVTLEEAVHGAVRRLTLRHLDARGHPEGEKTLQVRIPAGVHEGQRIRLAGQGNAKRGGRGRGDLFLRVRLARHPDFEVQGVDLYTDLNLAPWEAVLGVKATIPALDGSTSIRVPAGTSAGNHLRLRGLGLPRGDGTRGDLYAIARIQVPESVSAEERALWEKLAATSPFRARHERGS